MDLSPDLLRLYRGSTYSVRHPRGMVVFRVGVPSPDLDRLLLRLDGRQAIYITAWNPNSRATDPVENRLAQIKLKCDLYDRTRYVLSGYGEGAEGWREFSYFAVGLGRPELLELGTRYYQNAAILIEMGKAPELVLMPMTETAEA